MVVCTLLVLSYHGIPDWLPSLDTWTSSTALLGWVNLDLPERLHPSQFVSGVIPISFMGCKGLLSIVESIAWVYVNDHWGNIDMWHIDFFTPGLVLWLGLPQETPTPKVSQAEWPSEPLLWPGWTPPLQGVGQVEKIPGLPHSLCTSCNSAYVFGTPWSHQNKTCLFLQHCWRWWLE